MAIDYPTIVIPRGNSGTSIDTYAVKAGYRNLVRAKQGLPSQLSIGTVRNRDGMTAPRVEGYTSSAIFHDCNFVENLTTINAIYRNQVKSVAAWFVGQWVPTPQLPGSAGISTLKGKQYAIYAGNPSALPKGREVTISPKSDNPTLRHFYYRDTLEIDHSCNYERVDTTRRYTVTWTADNKCFIY